jgi:P-type Ca2+ transporter type 2C
MDLATRAGLGHEEARRRLAAEGPNALPSRERHGLVALVLGVLREPMFLLLLGAAGIYLVLGDVREALVLAASIVVIIAITVVQERRTERAVEALRDLSSPRALVIREGREVRIAGTEVVRGDLLMLREGDRVAADARLHEAHGFMVDESLLTGESVPVSKTADSGDERKARAYSGTLVVRGTALGEVLATGPRSELGRIGRMLEDVTPSKTSLEIETARIVRVLASFGLALCVLVAILFYLLRGDALAGILAGLTLAMSLLPEEFPVVLTVFLALGAMRIARHGVLTRRLPAVEMLGAATVLCCDKTGTLTENRMRVVEAWRGAWREADAWTAEEAPMLEAAALACETSPFDPMERAILEAAPKPGTDPGFSIERRYPMSETFLAVCHGVRTASGDAVAAIKGAPETVIGLCTMDAADRRGAVDAAAEAATRGLRVLAVASAKVEGEWPDSPRDLDFRFLGLVALADPVRPAVPAAIETCRRAGIRVVMITGDHPSTARAIARQSGIDATTAITGPELDAMDDAALAKAVKGCQVFARVRPEQKLRLVAALRAAGEVVAMTGDGVNDAPALKAAHIGVAMGKRGTDVAREAASLVLLEDDFTSIVDTVRLGRRIYDNIRNAMRFLLAVHVPLAGMALLPLPLGWPLFVFPVHVVFMEFLIDPSCSIVFEAEHSDEGTMERPPRPPRQPLFDAASLGLGLTLGVGVFGAVAAIYGWGIARDLPEGEVRAVAFATLVLANLGLILANRSPHLTSVELLVQPNPAFWWIAGGTLAALLASIHVPAAAEVFRFQPISGDEWALAGAAAVLSVAWYDVFKMLRRTFSRNALPV